MKNLILITSLGIFLLVSCGESKSKKIKSIESQREYLSANTDTLVFVEGKFKKEVESLNQDYLAFVDEYPEDSQASWFLYLAGNNFIKMKQFGDAISCYETVVATYPTDSLAPDCQFMLITIHEHYQYDLEKAKQNYEIFISKFPDHHLTEGLKMVLPFLGKEDLLLDSLLKQNAPIE
jgi:tetratricopeptide (TPR) repeat protein